MENDIFKHIAGQLRKPEGEMGKQVGIKMNSGNELINKWTIDLLHLQPYDHILEIGMGNGAFVKDIVGVDASIRYYGVDFSETMVEEANNINKDLIQNKQAAFILRNANQLPLGNLSIDKVFTINTIYFWEDVGKQFAEIHRVLKDEGTLVIAIRPKAMMKDYPFTRYGFNMFSKEELSALINSNGFVTTEVVEKEEPDQEINGKSVKSASLIVVSRKE
jgi:ubiquinone/menaquinone biosynthesis C-methylase UbiE